MSNIRYYLLCFGKTNKKCINGINIPINGALRCLHYKKYDDSVRLSKTKKNKNVKSLYVYELSLFMFKFNKSLLPASFNDYFKNTHKYHTNSSETNFFLPGINNKSGHKLLAYQGIN